MLVAAIGAVRIAHCKRKLRDSLILFHDHWGSFQLVVRGKVKIVVFVYGKLGVSALTTYARDRLSFLTFLDEISLYTSQFPT